jgi:hypothetical protein
MLVGVVVAILSIFGVWKKLDEKAIKVLSEKNAKIWEIAKGSVAETYQEYVQEIKKGKEDGKLTPEEAKKARGMAKDKMVAAAKENGVELATIAIPALIEKAVNFLKKDAQGVEKKA